MEQTEAVLALSKKKSAFFKKQLGRLFPDSNGQCTILERKKKQIAKEVESNDWLLADDYLSNLSSIYIRISQFSHFQLKDRDRDAQKRYFSQHALCAYQAVKVRSELARIQNKMNLSFGSKVMFWWSSLLFCEWEKEAEEVMALALQSTNDNKLGIMGEGGYPFDTYPYYLMELYSLWKGKPFDRALYSHPAVYPNELTRFIYDAPLENWNTKDLDLVDKLVSIMADYHISQTDDIPDDEHQEEKHFEFMDTTFHLYPFEILAWLKIRELSGLENPKKLSHPLMNQPLAEPITDKKLDKPTDLPEVEQLLALVRKHFPDANI